MPKEEEPELAGPTVPAIDPTFAGARGELLSEEPLKKSTFPTSPPSTQWLESWEDDRVYGICGPVPRS